MPSNVLPFQLKQIFPLIIWIFHWRWRWRWWDQNQATFWNLFYFKTKKNIEIGKRLRDLSAHFSVLLRKSCSVLIRTYLKKLRTFCRRRLSAPSHDRVGNFLKIICDQENTKFIHFFSIVLSRESHSLTLVLSTLKGNLIRFLSGKILSHFHSKFLLPQFHKKRNWLQCIEPM